MSDITREDKVFFDHIGQIVMTAVLQGVIVGGKDKASTEMINPAIDIIVEKASNEIMKHCRVRLQEVKEDMIRADSVRVF